jgi:hypothetical protein
VYADMERWTEIRRRVLTGAMSKRQARRHYQIHWSTLQKILAHERPPGYRRTRPPRRPTIEPFLSVIHASLDADKIARRRCSAPSGDAAVDAISLLSGASFNLNSQMPALHKAQWQPRNFDSGICSRC